MTISVGIDIGKGFHWACAVNETGAVFLNRKVLNTPDDLLKLSAELRTLRAPVCIGLDVLGGIAGVSETTPTFSQTLFPHITLQNQVNT